MRRKVNRNFKKIIRNRERSIAKRLERKNYKDQPKPIFQGSNIHYEISERSQAINCGGIGAIHQMVLKLELDKEINKRLNLLKVHLPYHESDHVLNIAYNVLTGGVRLEDIDLHRNDEAYMNGLGADRIPDPTTAGDFTRRFKKDDISELMDCINIVRQRVWSESSNVMLEEAVIDVDGTIAPTTGECKQGMDMSYKGIWGYGPLVISLANTNEVLYLVNRPGNQPSHQDSAVWIDRAIDLVSKHSKNIFIRGDTDFSLTGNFDKWSDVCDILFGMDARKGLISIADSLSEEEWEELERKPKYDVKTNEREKPENVKERIVIEREYKNIKLNFEDVAEFEYSPAKCEKTYRMVVLRKNLSVKKGETRLFDEIKYFFYITTRRDLTKQEVVEEANGRCNQENVIAQLKNGVNAMRMPVRDLNSNWAYMVMAALAWNLKSWFGLLMPNKVRGLQVIKIEFRRFLNKLILIPCQIIKTGGCIVYRILAYNDWLEDFFDTWMKISKFKFT